MNCQMMRVISSPSSSTTGFLTLILFRARVSCRRCTAREPRDRGGFRARAAARVTEPLRRHLSLSQGAQTSANASHDADRQPAPQRDRDSVRDRRGRPVVGVTHECDFPAEASDAAGPHVVAAAGRARRGRDRPPRARARARRLVAVRARRREARRARARPHRHPRAVRGVRRVVRDRRPRREAAARRCALGSARVVSLEPSSLDDVFATIAFLGELVGADAGAAALLLDAAATTRHRTPARRASATLAARARAGARVDRAADERGPLDAGPRRARRRRAVLGNPGANSRDAGVGRDRRERSGRRDRRAVRFRSRARAARDRGAAAGSRRSAFASLRAVREGRAYAMDGNAFVNRPGPRLVDTAELFAAAIAGAIPAASSGAIAADPRTAAPTRR